MLARSLIGDKAWIVSKIEKPSALDHLEEIIRLSDGIMVARGDLGVELPPERVPVCQKRIVRACRKAAKPVIVATQMLESMVSNPMPTRAEASDVANAVFDAADAVMLSAESAAGAYPVQAVRMMDKIICETEASEPYRLYLQAGRDGDRTTAGAVTAAARVMTETLPNAKAIVSYTRSGTTAKRMSQERPYTPILCMTRDEALSRRMMLYWGVRSAVCKREETLTDVNEDAVLFAKRVFGLESGDDLILTAGVPFAERGNTNLLQIITIK